MALKERLIAEYEFEVGVTVHLLEQIAALPLDWRPHARSRSLGELVSHLADVPAWGSYILDRLKFDLAMLPAAPVAPFDAASMLERFGRQAATTRRLLDKSDAELTAVWKLTNGEEDVFSMPRTTAFRRLALSHMIHHRGQLSVYARMNGAVVTTTYGAGADDLWDYAPSM